MRYKAVPEPPTDLRGLVEVHESLPRVPRSEGDCCGRIASRVDWIDGREPAREWLVFCRALGLARRESGGEYVRDETINVAAVATRVPDRRPPPAADVGARVDGSTSPETDRERLAAQFRRHVLGADRAIAALDDGPRPPAAVFEAVREAVPEWERRRRADWADDWRERTARLLGWATLLGLAERVDGGYVRAGSA